MKGGKMILRFITIVTGTFLITGCDRPPATRVSSTVLTLRSQSVGVVTFDAQIRKGDSLCWQHGDNGTVVFSTWPKDRIIVLTIAAKDDRLNITTDKGCKESIPIERVTLVENPRMEKGRYHVGEYVQKLGVARTPEISLYVYVKEGSEFQRDGAANGSQPIRSDTNRTSSAAGSRR